MLTVALDVMGGDHAPSPELEGALAAVRARTANIVLVGDDALIRRELARLGAGREGVPGLSIHHASEVIAMDDHPAQAIKQKKDSSMRVAFDLVKRGQAQAVVSAGNSGAMMACGTLVWKRTRGVERPGIVTTFPTRTGVCAMIDMGANVECRPLMLAQFAVLGSVYARVLHGKSKPRVGVLSNGTEVTKGTALTRGTYEILERHEGADFEFIGYVEGRDLFTGIVDVVVTDGFTGNIVLKTAEGAAQVIVDFIKGAINDSAMAKVGALIARSALMSVKKKLDYAESGGAPLIGVDGIAIICHGRSNAKAIANAIGVAVKFHQAALPQAIESAIANNQSLWKKGGATEAGGEET